MPCTVVLAGEWLGHRKMRGTPTAASYIIAPLSRRRWSPSISPWSLVKITRVFDSLSCFYSALRIVATASSTMVTMA